MNNCTTIYHKYIDPRYISYGLKHHACGTRSSQRHINVPVNHPVNPVSTLNSWPLPPLSSDFKFPSWKRDPLRPQPQLFFLHFLFSLKLKKSTSTYMKKMITVIFTASYTWPWGQCCPGPQDSQSIFRLLLGSRRSVKAGSCCKTASGGTVGAKVVNFCPDSLEPVQAMEDYLLNSSRTAAEMGSISSVFQ